MRATTPGDFGLKASLSPREDFLKPERTAEKPLDMGQGEDLSFARLASRGAHNQLACLIA